MKDNGGSAFPIAERFYHDERTGNTVFVSNTGLTLRDYFAAKAMAANLEAAHAQEWSFDGHDSFDDMIAHYSYGLADAMLRARVTP